jgi:CRP/FNR family transcriptional regulator, cyclic AMP receptor protein
MNNTSALWYFESVNLYGILCPPKVKALGEKHYRNFKRGAYIYFPDEPATHIYMIVSGRVQIGSFQDDGKETVSSILSTGELFGELALAGEEKRKDYAQAIDADTTLCTLSIGELKALMFENKELSFKVLKLIGLRLMKLERKLELLVFKDARTRVVEFLKDAASWKGKKVGFETMIPTRLTHKDIAALTGTSRQTVTTILNELKDKNLINFDRKKILIRDLANLK